jgi:hypothetical protein
MVNFLDPQCQGYGNEAPQASESVQKVLELKEGVMIQRERQGGAVHVDDREPYALQP